MSIFIRGFEASKFLARKGILYTFHKSTDTLLLSNEISSPVAEKKPLNITGHRSNRLSRIKDFSIFLSTDYPSISSIQVQRKKKIVKKIRERNPTDPRVERNKRTRANSRLRCRPFPSPYLVCGIPYLMPTPTRGSALITFFTVAWSGNANRIEAAGKKALKCGL